MSLVTRRRFLELGLGAGVSSLFPINSALSSIREPSFSEDTTFDVMPQWVKSGEVQSEIDRGKFEIYYSVLKNERLSDVSQTLGLKKKEVIKQIGKDKIREGEKLVLDVPVKNFQGFLPYYHDKNKSVLAGLSGKTFCDLEEKLGFRRIAFLVGEYLGEHKKNEQDDLLVHEIAAMCHSYLEDRNVDSNLFKGLLKQESGGYQWSISKSGAYGVCQLKPLNLREATWSDNIKREPVNPFMVLDCAKRGIDYLALLINKYKDLDEAIGRYHDGETIDRVKVDTVENYVKPVLKFAKQFS